MCNSILHTIPDCRPGLTEEKLLLNDGLALVISITFYEHVIFIKMRSSTSFILAEAGEVLCFLGTVLRQPDTTDRLSYCTPSVRTTNNPNKFDINYKTASINHACEQATKDNHTCWHKLFKNRTIAVGYPINARPEAIGGMQASADIMAALSCTTQAVMFDGTLLVKGLVSMFVPVLKVGTMIVWHYLLNDDRRWMLHSEARERCVTVAEVQPDDLVGASHFVGWTRSADILAGEPEVQRSIET